MIEKKDFLPVGQVKKSVGIDGRIDVLMNAAAAQLDWSAMAFVFLVHNELPVPYYIEDVEGYTDTLLRLRLEDVDDESSARKLVGLEVCIARHDAIYGDKEGDIHYQLLGSEVYDHNKFIGRITQVYDETVNVLIEIDGEQLAPLHPDFIERYDAEEHALYMLLPEGLFEK